MKREYFLFYGDLSGINHVKSSKGRIHNESLLKSEQFYHSFFLQTMYICENLPGRKGEIQPTDNT